MAKSTRFQENGGCLCVPLSGGLDLLDFGDEDARTAGQIRAVLEKDGRPIDAYDLLIAGQALRRGSPSSQPTPPSSTGLPA